MPLHGVFVDPSEYRRNNFDFSGDRLTALSELVSKDWITLLQTDVSVLETQNLIRRVIEKACEPLRKGDVAPLKSVADERLNVFKMFPSTADLAAKLVQQFDDHVQSGSFSTLGVSDVDPAHIFDAYFKGEPPFDVQKKKFEFPDAFTLQRLIMWAVEKETTVYVVGPDDDLKRTCKVREQLEHFEKIEALLNHINSADALVQRLQEKPQDLIEMLSDFVRAEFGNLMFMLEYNPHGEVGNVSVSDIEIQDIYALAVGDQKVRSEAEVNIDFTADFSYEDLDTGFYDKETDEHYMTDYVEGEAEDICKLSVHFDFTVDVNDRSRISNFSFSEDTITVEEEDRGDYGAYK